MKASRDSERYQLGESLLNLFPKYLEPICVANPSQKIRCYAIEEIVLDPALLVMDATLNCNLCGTMICPTSDGRCVICESYGDTLCRGDFRGAVAYSNQPQMSHPISMHVLSEGRFGYFTVLSPLRSPRSKRGTWGQTLDNTKVLTTA